MIVFSLSSPSDRTSRFFRCALMCKGGNSKLCVHKGVICIIGQAQSLEHIGDFFAFYPIHKVITKKSRKNNKKIENFSLFTICLQIKHKNAQKWGILPVPALFFDGIFPVLLFYDFSISYIPLIVK